MKSTALETAVPHLIDRVREGGLLVAGYRILVMFSGGGDSVALLAAAARICGAEYVTALHVNYGLRGEQSDADENYCRELCEKLGVVIVVERVTLGQNGNLHDLARAARYKLARQAAERTGCDTIAVAHNADDRAETLLYRLAASPGRRALLGMPRRRGMIVRPLLDFTREELRAWCAAESLTWREDAANRDPRYARTNVREALALLRRVHPAAIENILRTADELGAEGEALDAMADALLDGAVTDAGGLRVAALDAAPESLAGLALRAYVERNVGAPVPAARGALDRVRVAAAAGGSREIDVAGAGLMVEYGVLRVIGAGRDDAATNAARPPAGEPTPLPVPGVASFGGWCITASIGSATDGDEAKSVPAATLRFAHIDIPVTFAQDLTIRTRRPGDRMRPLGLNGGKSLQDVFVDAKLPRAERDAHPVVCAGERIVWVPGVAIGEGCARLPAAAGETVVRIKAERRAAADGHTPKLPRT
ncbi:MAG: tRNA lysidine(34) synthetase TilS [Actinobacteria bacterium]|nr:tRNA lysidine(34) synthetase TilS [Actinomycetota bacterium]